MLKEYLTNIANAIRSKLGTTNKVNAQDFADKVNEVYDKGYNDNPGINPNWTNFSYMFYNGARSESISKLRRADTSNCTDFRQMFYQCDNITEIPEIDTSKGENFYQMFYSCDNLENVPELDTSNGTNVSQAFYNCEKLKNVPSKFNTSNSTSINGLFYGCEKLTTISGIDTSNCTDIGQAFRGCSILETIPKLNLSKVTSAYNPFGYCYKLKNITFEGEIKVSMEFSYSPLSVESMKSIINHLFNYSGTDKEGKYKVTFTSTCWNNLGASPTPYEDGLTNIESLTWQDYISELGWLTA